MYLIQSIVNTKEGIHMLAKLFNDDSLIGYQIEVVSEVLPIINSKENNIKVTKNTCDVVIKLTNGDIKKYIQIESQTRPDKNMLQRLFKYKLNLMQKYSEIKNEESIMYIPKQAVIHILKEEKLLFKHTYIFPDGFRKTVDVEVFNLPTMSIEMMFEEHLDILAPLKLAEYADLSKKKLSEKKINKLNIRLNNELRLLYKKIEEESDYLTIEMLLAIEYFKSEISRLKSLTIEKEVGDMSLVLGKNIYKEGIDEGIATGIIKGMQKGMQKGMKKGMHEGLYLAYKDMGLSDFEIEEKIKLLEDKQKKLST